MFTSIISNYTFLVEQKKFTGKARGTSAAPRKLIFDIPLQQTSSVDVLDIGFGMGNLGYMIKELGTTKHWNVDGVDGFEANCYNPILVGKKIYRNIWFGLAQDIPSDVLKKYNVICLLDVIEHLSADMAKKLIHHLLSGMADDAYFFISTPLWFYPQNHIQDGDLEEHLIGVPATSMMELHPIMYAINHPLVGGFVYKKETLNYIDCFRPVTDKNFTYERGMAIVQELDCYCPPGVVVHVSGEK